MTDSPATDEQALALYLYAALHRLEHAVDAAILLARSPHWIGGRELAIVPFGLANGDPLYALFDLSEDTSGEIRNRAVSTLTAGESPELVSIPTVEEAPTVPLWPTAATAFGIKKATAYDKLAPSGQLCEGVPIIRVGGQWRVPTAALRRKLQLDEPT